MAPAADGAGLCVGSDTPQCPMDALRSGAAVGIPPVLRISEMATLPGSSGDPALHSGLGPRCVAVGSSPSVMARDPDLPVPHRWRPRSTLQQLDPAVERAAQPVDRYTRRQLLPRHGPMEQ